MGTPPCSSPSCASLIASFIPNSSCELSLDVVGGVLTDDGGDIVASSRRR